MDNDNYTTKYPAAAQVMSAEEFESLVDVFRTLLTWKQETETAKEEEQWTVSSSTESRTGNKKTVFR